MQSSVKIDTVLAPCLIPETDLKGSIAAVIDVLRATTTIVTAFASGAANIRPFSRPAEVRAYAAQLGEGLCLLSGEEKGLRIPDFHLGNSPLEYLDSDMVANKTILFSTTNGTPTMQKTYHQSRLPVYIAALVNCSSVSAAIVKEIESGSAAKIALVCSGRHGQPGAEDIFCAGLIAGMIGQRLLQNRLTIDLTDSSMIAMVFAAQNKRRPLDVLAESEHGSYLKTIGFTQDLEFAAQIDKYDKVPVFNGEDITLGQGE
ncbi:MAG: 2-phosphosulfolactate phosphatase [Chloroflexota bacterium]